MTRRHLLPLTAAVCAALALTACAQNRPKVIESTKSAVELRAIQTRTFDTADRNRMVRAIVATLLDRGYRIEKVDGATGTVSAEKLSQLSLSASVYPRGEGQTVVRANAIVAGGGFPPTQVDEPLFYQKMFFAPLSQAVFLDAATLPDAELPAEAAAAPEAIIPNEGPEAKSESKPASESASESASGPGQAAQ